MDFDTFFTWFLIMVMVWLLFNVINSFVTIIKKGRFYELTLAKKGIALVAEFFCSAIYFLAFIFGMPWSWFFLVLSIMGVILILVRIKDIGHGETRVFVSPMVAAINLVVSLTFICVFLFYLVIF